MTQIFPLPQTIHHDRDPELKEALEYVLRRCYIGDWFLLLQVYNELLIRYNKSISKF